MIAECVLVVKPILSQIQVKIYVEYVLDLIIAEPKCNDIEAINYFEDALNIDNTKCIYNLCEDYYENNNDYLCDLNGSPPYELGEQLSCETVTTEFSLLLPRRL